MTFNIRDFSAQINKHGLAVNNLFVVRISPPQKLAALGAEYNLGRDMVFFCQSVGIPGLEVETSNYFSQGFGVPETKPTQMAFQPLSAVFMVDQKFVIKKFFYRWMQMIYNYDTSAGPLAVDAQTKSAEKTQGVYEIGYKEDYVGNMDIIVYSQHSDDPALKYKYYFGNIFPTSVGSVSAGWENVAEVMTLPITFAYDDFKSSGTLEGVVSSDFNRGNGLLNYVSALNSYGQAIDQLHRPRNVQDLINQIYDVKTIFNSF